MTNLSDEEVRFAMVLREAHPSAEAVWGIACEFCREWATGTDGKRRYLALRVPTFIIGGDDTWTMTWAFADLPKDTLSLERESTGELSWWYRNRHGVARDSESVGDASLLHGVAQFWQFLRLCREFRREVPP